MCKSTDHFNKHPHQHVPFRALAHSAAILLPGDQLPTMVGTGLQNPKPELPKSSQPPGMARPSQATGSNTVQGLRLRV